MIEEELAEDISHLRTFAIDSIAHSCARVRLASTRKALSLETLFDEFEEPSESDREQVRSSSAVQQVMTLARSASRVGGYEAARTAVNIACDFFESNGMAYRALERDAISGEQKQKPVSDGGRIPSWLTLWRPASINFSAPALGTESLIGVDRERLLDCAQRFYVSGIRCSWFERMLVEAIISAELFSTVQEARRNPVALTGRQGFVRTLVWTWLYESTHGKGHFEYLVSLAHFALGGIKAALIVGLGLYSAYKYEQSESWLSLLGIAVAAWLGLNMVGRFTVQRIVSWSRQPAEETMKRVKASPLGKTLLAMITAHGATAGPVMCPMVVRDLLLDAVRARAAFDPIVFSFLDRAHASGEHAWTRG